MSMGAETVHIGQKGDSADGRLSAEDQWLLFQVLSPVEAEEFLSLLEVLLPHDGMAYAAARQATALSLDSTMVGDLGLRSLVLGGLKSLRKNAMSGQDFVARSLEERSQIVASHEDEAWFQTILHLAKFDFYNRHIVWREMKYPDLGNESGYLDKGFDRLPE